MFKNNFRTHEYRFGVLALLHDNKNEGYIQFLAYRKQNHILNFIL